MKKDKKILGENRKNDLEDIGHPSAKALTILAADLLLLPGSGSIVGLLFDTAFATPAVKRLQKALALLSDKIASLDEVVNNGKFNIDNLKENEEFISLFAQIVPSMIKTHREEKLRYLANALINSYLLEIDFDLKTSLISRLDVLTPSHIRILRFLAVNREKWKEVDDYKVIYDMFRSENAIVGTSIDLFIYLTDQLSQENLVAISAALKSRTTSNVRRSTVYGPSSEDEDSPYIAITKLGQTMLQLVDEYTLTA